MAKSPSISDKFLQMEYHLLRGANTEMSSNYSVRPRGKQPTLESNPEGSCRKSTFLSATLGTYPSKGVGQESLPNSATVHPDNQKSQNVIIFEFELRDCHLSFLGMVLSVRAVAPHTLCLRYQGLRVLGSSWGVIPASPPPMTTNATWNTAMNSATLARASAAGGDNRVRSTDLDLILRI